MTWIVVDVESDGPCPPMYSMVSFGAAVVADPLKGFKGETCPISEQFIPEALAVSGVTREQHMNFAPPAETLASFDRWLSELPKPLVFVSDNPAYDWCFMNYYLWAFLGRNPFGHSARRIGDIWGGLRRNVRDAKWKSFRETKHTHDPLDDARGNAEALRIIARDVQGIL